MILLDKYRVAEAEHVICRLWNTNAVKLNKNATKTFTVIMPPPNVTGNLHIGHALNLFLQDTLVRNRRLHGDDVLWQPGKDHAGIATQLLVEKNLKQNQVAITNLSRAELLKHANDWCDKYGVKIEEQMRRLGIVCNWSRFRFTLDKQSSQLVTKIFVKLYHQGLIYRDFRLVNWDCELQTAISDLEVESREQSGILWYIKYPLVNQPDQSIVIATTRPETMWGDTALAINPQDNRYRQYIGQRVQIPLTERTVPVIGDDYVKMDYGSGALKITPGHDFNDFAVGRNHHLPLINILNADGTLNYNVPTKYQNLSWREARKATVQDLKEQNLIVKQESIVHRIPYGDRTNSIIQPRLTKQWMMNCQTLARQAIEVVRKGQIEFLPIKWQKIYVNWLENIQPWCLSRQLWWGHQIPAWYDENGRIFVADSLTEAEKQAKQYYGYTVSLTRDNDVLDTWFSSGLWSMSTLDWPFGKDLIARHYPTDILVTSFDIIFFWVARMIMLSLFETQGVPFRQVYIHALIRDEKGRKMSKSKGNVIDPLEVVQEFGSDALRLALLSMVVPGQDICISKSRIVGYGHFVHKIWNLAKFINNHCFVNHETTDNNLIARQDNDGLWVCPVVILSIHIWLLNLYKKYLSTLNQNYQDRNFSGIANLSYTFIWNEVCDRYLECAKIILRHGSVMQQHEVKTVMRWLLPQLLILLHPIMPHVTEYIWQQLSLPGLLMQQSWPQDSIDFSHLKPQQVIVEQQDFCYFWQLVNEIRSIRSELDITANTPISIYVQANDWPWLRRYWYLLQHLVYLQDYYFQETNLPTGIRLIINDYHITMLVITNQESRARNRQLLQQKLCKAQLQLTHAESRLLKIDKSKMPLDAQKESARLIQGYKNRILRLKSIEQSFH